MPKKPPASQAPQTDEQKSPWRTAATFAAHVDAMRAAAVATGADQVVHDHLRVTDGALTQRVYPSGVAT